MQTFSYLRVQLFKKSLRPFQAFMRVRRMNMFIDIVKPFPGMNVLDLGGQPQIWDFVEPPLNITCLNLPGMAKKEHATHHNITYVEGDACDMPHFQPGDFDVVFSNSVIEHVGNADKQAQFAREVERLSNTYWIQTPCKNFPIEAHCGMPFWWYYPKGVRQFFINVWSRNQASWGEMVATTTYINPKDLKQMLPSARVIREWFVFPKSMIAYSISTERQSVGNQ